MRDRKVRFLLKISSVAILALFLSWGGAVQAQIVFDGTDWTGDRGNLNFPVVPSGGTSTNGDVLRVGYLPFFADPNPNSPPDPANPKDHPLTNPGAAVPRWVWPFTRDLAQLNPFQDLFQPIIVDNEDLQGRLAGYAKGTADPLDPQEGATDTKNPFYPYASSGFGNNADPARVSPLPRTHPPYAEPKTDVAGQNPTYPALVQQAYPQSRLLPIRSNNTSPWVLPSLNDNGNNDRAPGQGFSIGTDATQPYNYDYYYVFATHDDFLVNRGSNGGQTPVTDAEIALLPNAPSNVYRAVHNRLVKSVLNNEPISVWTSGGQAYLDTDKTSSTYGLYVKPYVPGVRSDKTQTSPYYPYHMATGRYEIDLYSPGDGTFVAGDTSGFPHGNIRRALVRVSWYKTVNPDGSLNFGPGTPSGGGINDPVNSRIFTIDLGQSSWIPIQGGGLGPGSFNFDGNPANQLTVTLYSLTPEDTSRANPLYGTQAPLVTADAVRFVPQLVPTYEPDPNNPGKQILVPPPDQLSRYHQDPNYPNDPTKRILDWTITGYGRILAATVGTSKFANNFTPNSATLNPVEPVTYVAREEGRAEINLANPPLRTFVDPTVDNSTPAPDPTALSTLPVFYCLDNRNGDIVQHDNSGNPLFDASNNPLYITSAQKVRWRFEAVADMYNSQNNPTNNSLGGATTVSSPMLANVRCRDGNIRTMVYFLTTSGSGQLGHIYALDPIGNKDTNTGLPLQNTNAYWIYPSYRPLLGSEPAQAPVQFEDPNFTLPKGVVRPGGYPQPTIADAPATIDGNGKPVNYYDGDIVPDSTGQFYVVKSDTQVHMGGIQGAPIIVEDPGFYQKNGLQYAAQLLVVPSADGRIYTFDAGGRLDFGTAVAKNGTKYTAAGTTQRIWTWPHLAADTYHEKFDANGIFTSANPYTDDPSKVNFLTSLAQDFNLPVAARPVLATAGDGHLYALQAGRETFGMGPIPLPAGRLTWQFPSPSKSLNPKGTYSASISTPAIFKNNVYFTCNGRIYAVAEIPQTVSTPPATNALTWVYPYTNNIPYPINNVPASDPLDPGLNNTAPLVIAASNIVQSPDIPANLRTPNADLPPDTVYVTQGNGTMLALNAAPTGSQTTTNYAYGNTLLGGNSRVSPIGSLVTSQLGLDPNLPANGTQGDKDNPVNVIGDDDGFLSAFGMVPTSDSYDANGIPNGTYNVLPLLWTVADTTSARTAAAMLVGGDHFDNSTPITSNATGKTTAYHLESSQNNPNQLAHGLLVEGDNGGQVRAYGVGYGTSALYGTGSTTGPGEPPVYRFGPGLVSIDMRGIDFYTESDYNEMALAVRDNQKKTPAYDATGKPFSQTATPRPGSASLPNNGVAVDWGDYLYVSVYGVYHAQIPKDLSKGTYWGQTVPQITVNFTVTQPGQGSRRYSFTVPNVTPSREPTSPGFLTDSAADPTYTNDFAAWPDDCGITLPEGLGLQIFTVDANNPADTNNPQNPGAVKGPAFGTFPWVGKYRIHIRPDRNSNFAPGNSNYRITAYATIQQTFHDSTQTSGNEDSTISNNSVPLTVGQRDYAGMSFSSYQTSPNIRRGPRSRNANGPTRPVYVTNPIALSIQGNLATSFANPAPYAIGWSGDVSTINSAAALNEVLNNDNKLDNPANPSAVGNYKELFAPVGMATDGSSVPYQVVDTNGNNPTTGVYIMDRSNLYKTTGKALQVQLSPSAFTWLGGPSSVMNPLPWEQLPNDVSTTQDYPAISPTALSATFSTGESPLNAPSTLLHPSYDNTLADPVSARVPQPTSVDFGVNVPRYQPANVNYGPTSFQGANFGSNFVDLNGNNFPSGSTAGTSRIFGPLIANGTNSSYGSAFPAAGYVATIGVVAAVPGKPVSPWGSGPTSPGGQNSQFTTREFHAGLTIAPRITMRFQESGLDLGKLPHGTGYTDKITSLNAGPPYYNSVTIAGGATTAKGVFQPSMDGNPTPWDNPDPTTPYGGAFFLPFTLISESNVNLVDVRIAKLLGQANAAVGYNSLLDVPLPNFATAARLTSDQVAAFTNQDVFALAILNLNAGGGLGNIGVVSSFDHVSTRNQPANKGMFENYFVWSHNGNQQLGVANPFVTQTGISAAGLPTSGPFGWQPLYQPTPTIHKPGVGDSTGTTATIPDMPHSVNPAALTATISTVQTKIGVAIPPGTPSGTYSAPVYAFEDNTPLQWRNWLTLSQGATNATVGADHDNILNTNTAGSPVEAHTDPPLNLKVTVREAQLTNGVTPGTMPQIDPFSSSAALHSLNLLPTALRSVVRNGAGTPVEDYLHLYWTTNRVSEQGQPSEPYRLAYSYLPGIPHSTGIGTVLDEVNFAAPSNSSSTNSLPQLWSTPYLFPATSNDKVPLAFLFPQDKASAQSAASTISNGVAPPILPGSIVASTARFASPTAAQIVDTTSNADIESWLFWQGVVEKTSVITASASGQPVNGQLTDSRTFYMPLNGTRPGTPGSKPTYLSILNDPGLPKFAPKPLLLKTAKGKFSFLFYYTGNKGKTTIYYTVNTDANLAMDKWTPDIQLPVPSALTWQSDPNPIFRQVPINGTLTDVIDVVYTGVLHNHQKAEVLLSRYIINEGQTKGQPLGTLQLTTLSPVQQETLSQVGATHTYVSRDAAWFLHSSDPTTAAYDNLQIGLVDPTNPNGTVTQLLAADATGTLRGTVDPTSGLVYYNSALGGQIVVDPSTGSITFPNVAPNSAQQLIASYMPQAMRLTTTRDDTNVLRPLGQGLQNEPAFKPNAAVQVSGDNSAPVAFLDRGTNNRYQLTSPQVIFPAGQAPSVDRMWVMYRKSDPSAGVKSSIYYKTMRLMAKLPNGVVLSKNAGGVQSLNVTVKGNVGPYEVDWVRGRVYFTSVDEGRTVTVSYTGVNGNSYQNIPYRVAWDDEISAASTTGTAVDPTTPEVVMPSDSVVNEGQVIAFKDALNDKVWIFWASSRGNTTDLFYQTISPQLYPTAANQQ